MLRIISTKFTKYFLISMAVIKKDEIGSNKYKNKLKKAKIKQLKF